MIAVHAAKTCANHYLVRQIVSPECHYIVRGKLQFARKKPTAKFSDARKVAFSLLVPKQTARESHWGSQGRLTLLALDQANRNDGRISRVHSHEVFQFHRRGL